MMHAAVCDRRRHWILFMGLVVAVYTAALALAGRLPSLDRADLLAGGLTVDMVIVVPAAFYFLVVRRRGLSILTLSRPMLAEGPYGLRRTVRALGIEPDEAEAFDHSVGDGGDGPRADPGHRQPA